MTVDGKQLKSATVANSKLATASSTASANSVVLSNANGKIDLGYLPVDELSGAFVEDPLETLGTSADGDPMGETGLSSTPGASATVMIYLNGIMIRRVSYGDKTGSVFFSNNDGQTAAERSALAAGSKLYWNGSVAGFQLQAGWSLKVVYTL